MNNQGMKECGGGADEECVCTHGATICVSRTRVMLRLQVRSNSLSVSKTFRPQAVTECFVTGEDLCGRNVLLLCVSSTSL